MIYFDVTKTIAARHRSGLTRVSVRLREELGDRVREVVWRGEWRDASSEKAVALAAEDWVITPELFSEAERPGFRDFIQRRACRSAAIFHDAIPLKFPQITWPQSVARHPEYLKLLASLDRVFAVSDTSRSELLEFWRWQGATVRATVETIHLGADFARGASRPNFKAAQQRSDVPALLCVGILEPRKNQSFLVQVAEQLAREEVLFQLKVFGRVNPHFGKPVETVLRRASKAYPQIQYLGSADDATVLAAWRDTRASVFPTVAEGCGLPLLESLGMGVPCIASDLPVLRENEAGGGCEFVPVNDLEAWTSALRRLLTDETYAKRLASEARDRVVPTWRQTADGLIQQLNS